MLPSLDIKYLSLTFHMKCIQCIRVRIELYWTCTCTCKLTGLSGHWRVFVLVSSFYVFWLRVNLPTLSFSVDVKLCYLIYI